MDILTMGELLVEIMRDTEGASLREKGIFLGPFPSGAPAICIDTAARLGCSTAIIGGVGRDDFGDCILKRLERDGVDTDHVLISPTGSTGCAFVTYFADGSRKFIFHMDNTPAVAAKAPSQKALGAVRYFHIMGCSLTANAAFGEEILHLMHRLKADGTKISFDPNIRRELLTGDPKPYIHDLMDHVNIFLPGLEELLLITDSASEAEAVEKCFSRPSMEVIVLKNGSKGSRIYTRDGMSEIGVYKIIQKDATGAGDCFDGAFLAGLCQGRDLVAAAKMGAAAGALNAAAFGPMEGDISPETVENMLRGTAEKEENPH